MVDKKVKEVKVEMTEIEKLQAKIVEMKNLQKLEMTKLKAETVKLREKAKELKVQEKAEKIKLKAEEAKLKAQKLAETLKNQDLTPKVNMTQKVQEMMLAGMSIEEMMNESGFTRKAILDRRWLIEKKLGLR